MEQWIALSCPDSEGILLANGLDEAFIGIGHRGPNLLPFAVYDIETIIQILMTRDGMTREEAQEFFDYNVLAARVGEQCPMYVESMP